MFLLHSACIFSQDPTQALFTVFDGHGGTEAAIYSAAHLHYHMVRHPAFTDDPISAINDSFTHTDEQFVAKAKREVNRLHASH